MRKKNVVNAEEKNTTAGKKNTRSVPQGSMMSLRTFVEDMSSTSTLPEYGEASLRKIPSKK